MRTIILTFLMLLNFTCFSQKIDYPLITKDSLGNKVVILTINQMKYIDNRLDMLDLLIESNNLMSIADSICMEVINEKEKVILKQDSLINNVQFLLNDSDLEIKNLKDQIDTQKDLISVYEEELENKNSEIEILSDEVTEFKNKKIFSNIVTGISAIIAIIVISK